MDAPASGINDFQVLMDLEREGKTCERVDVVIDKYCPCNEEWTEEYYKGYLRLSKGEWDVSGCKVTIPVEVNDTFTCLTTEWTKYFNLFDYGDEPIEVTPFYGVLVYQQCQYDHTMVFDPIPPWETMIAQIKSYVWNNFADDCISSGEGWTPIKHTYKAEFELKHSGLFGNDLSMHVHLTVRTQYAREMSLDISEPPGNGWIGGPPWFRAVNIVSLPVLDHTTSEGLQALAEEWGETVDVGFLSINQIVGLDADGNSILTNGKEMGPVLEDWAEQCDLTIISNFFNINPDETNPDNEYYERAEYDAHGIVLFQVTDVARIDETESATIALTTFKKIIDALKVAFNVDVDIEDGGVLRIEHKSYWQRPVNMDLTLPAFFTWIKSKWKYTYDQAKLPKREHFRWAVESDKTGGDFDGYPIEYDNNCVNDIDDPQEEDYNADQFLTNIVHVVNNEDFFDSDIILMVSTTDGVINYAVQPISGRNKLNGTMSFGYLLPRYHDHSRPFKEGFINKIQTAFYRSLRNKIQADISIPFQCDDYMNNYDPSGLVKTQLGGGEIDKATYVEPDGQLTLTLKHK